MQTATKPSPQSLDQQIEALTPDEVQRQILKQNAYIKEQLVKQNGFLSDIRIILFLILLAYAGATFLMLSALSGN